MDVTRLGETALTGWRKKVADAVAGPASSRLPVDADQVRALLGAVFFALAVRYVVATIRNATRSARER